jgi:hypothetical protein
MDIPNPIRSTLEGIVSALGAAISVLSVMKLFEAAIPSWSLSAARR